MKKLMMVGLLMAAGMVVAAEVKTAGGLTQLEGLFGAKLGTVLNVNVPVNEQGVISMDYHPQKPFLSFTDYALFATPLTKRVYQIRAIAPSVPATSSSLADDAVRLIEMKFDGIMVKVTGNRVLTFANGDFICVSQKDGCVTIDAVRSDLMKKAEEESRKMDGGRFAEDVMALQLVLKTRITGTTNEIVEVCSVFDKAFGEPLADSDKAKRLVDGSWSTRLPRSVQFVGCNAYEAFASAKTKRVFRIRAVKEGVNDKDDFARLRRGVEAAFGVLMVQKGADDCCSLQIANVLITLSWNAEKTHLSLDFTDAGVFVLHENELKSMPEEKYWHDIDAL